MMITDGQLLLETYLRSNAYKGVAVILGTGAMLDGTALWGAANVKYYGAGARDINSGSYLSTYLKTTLARTICVDAMFANVTDTMIKGGFIQFSFSKATATPTVLVSGTPTWGLMLVSAMSTGDGQQFLQATYGQNRAIRTYLFSVGAPNSGADLIIPGDGSLVAGQIFRMNDIKIPINGLVC